MSDHGSVRRDEQWTESGVRLRRAGSRPGRWNWLFLPGGPGLGSESVAGLAEAAGVPGTAWLVDLPGDGSNRDVSEVPAEPYARWPGVLVEAARALDDVVMVGHSTGGMYLLSVPELEPHLAGLVLVSSAPHAGWLPAFAEYAARHPIPGIDEATRQYEREPGDPNLRRLALASAPWNFTAPFVPEGRALLSRCSYNHAAVAWSGEHFDDEYRARWAPASLPVLIVSGAEDRIVDQSLWQDEPAFTTSNILRRRIGSAGHFPWVENPAAVRAAFADLTGRLGGPA
ncbi:alpha/beta fold hydrolase [Streptomyces sp. NPDC048639]|uniref:alpha/beta fold hydrolase n=1 Tax=Streptomyces sp. NPDC048639 TaxID=3365581 RepID=UPI0037228AC1